MCARPGSSIPADIVLVWNSLPLDRVRPADQLFNGDTAPSRKIYEPGNYLEIAEGAGVFFWNSVLPAHRHRHDVVELIGAGDSGSTKPVCTRIQDLGVLSQVRPAKSANNVGIPHLLFQQSLLIIREPDLGTACLSRGGLAGDDIDERGVLGVVAAVEPAHARVAERPSQNVSKVTNVFKSPPHLYRTSVTLEAVLATTDCVYTALT